MKKLDDETRKKLDDKFDDIYNDFHEVLKKHGFGEVSFTSIHFGMPVEGDDCGSGRKWRLDISRDPAVLVCI